MKLIVGIDFGTSTTVVRYKEEGTDVIKPIKDADGVSDIIPSAIFRVDGQNQTLYGCGALNAKTGGMQGELITNFKMGLLDVNPEERRIKEAYIEEFFTYIYKQFWNQTRGIRYDSMDVYASVPAKWDTDAREVMKRTVKKAGFGENSICENEPTAAAYTMLHQHLNDFQKTKMLTVQKPMHVFMLDMGAGTTDIVIFRLKVDSEGRVATDNVLSYPTRDNRTLCGGREIDSILYNYILESLVKGTGKSKEELEQWGIYSVDKAKSWKDKYLSYRLKDNITIDTPNDFLPFLKMSGVSTQQALQMIRFNRQIFENETKEHWLELYKLIESAVAIYKEKYGKEVKGAEDIDLLFLTGGHSQWYCIPNLFNGEGINGYIGKDVNNGQGIVKALNFKKLREEPWRMFGDALPHECVATGLCLQDSNIKITTPTANNVWVRLTVNEQSSDYIQILKVGDLLPVQNKQSLEVTLSRNLVFGDCNFNITIELYTGENIETANRKILKLRQDENSVLGALIVAIMVLPIFFPVNYKFKINLCVDALEDGTLDVSGDCMMDNRENTRKEFSLKDMQEV